MTGARTGAATWLRRLAARALARDLPAFVAPDPATARALGLDLAEAGLRVVPTPRHAAVLVLVGELPEGLRRAAAVAYAQMPRPRAILAIGAGALDPLPEPDVAVPADQDTLARGVGDLRGILVVTSFSPGVAAFDAAAVRTERRYTCPMHPEIVRDAPGKCPICGMNLIPQEEAGGQTGHEGMAMDHGPGPGHGAMHDASGGAAGVDYTCPMHPEVSSAVPSSCPICGMDLVPRDAQVAGPTHNPAEDQPTEAAPGGYTCPMHPEVSSDTPRSCPSCGMDLVPRRAPGTSGDNRAEHSAHTVAGDYSCPMHPEVTRDAPGSCPICGMDLVPRGKTGGGESTPLHSPANHRATPADDPPRPGGAVASGHAGHGDHGSASHSGRATTTAEGAGGVAHGAMGHGGMTATAPPHPAVPAAGHGVAVHAAPATGGADDPHDTPGLAAGDMAAMGQTTHGMGGMAHGGHDTGAHEMGDAGDMDHSMHAMGGFMSMVAMTRDLPRSRDGLPMEWAEVPFGPLSPGLPGGLALVLTLDGDVVARATRAAGPVRRGLVATWPGPRETFPDRFARLDPLTPVAYRLLAQRALETAAGLTLDAREARARVAALERERAASHLGWLAGFAELLGVGWLAERSAALQLALARAADPDALVPLHGEALRLAAGVERLPLLRRRLAAIGRPGEAAERRGPVARAAGVTADARAADPAYRALGFAPLVREGDDALARLLVRLAEIGQSLDLAIAAGDGAAAAPPPRHGTDGGERGTATLETPRGAATLHLLLDAGTVREAHLDAPSGGHAPLIAAVAEGRELADALVGIASLDLSPWELDR